jgi:hypothetical protein
MSLLVGKPVAPPPGWRGPEVGPPQAPSIYARVSQPPTTEQPRAVAPPEPPPAPPPRPAPPPPPTRPTPPPAAPPSSVPAAFSRANLNPGAAAGQNETTTTQVEPEETPFAPSALEASIVGPPPSLARAVESGREHAAAARRTAQAPEPPDRSEENQLPTLVISGTALIALALAAFFLLRPTSPTIVAVPSAAPSVTVPPPVTMETVQPRAKATGPAKTSASPPAVAAVASPIRPSIAPSAALRAASQAAHQAVAPTVAPAPPPTQRPATPKPKVALAPKPSALPKPQVVRRPRPPNPNTIVAIQGVDAHYGGGGRAVGVRWGANGQSSATVQLSGDKGEILSQADVAGTRQSAVMYVPKTYRGSVFVQVISIGYHGERVTQSTSLPPYSR